jgi:steroid delta-isomerase-like uncharacterized protein
MEAQTATNQSPALSATEVQNLESVTNVLPFWNRGDIPSVLEFYDPGIVWTNVAMEEVYRGHDGVGEYLQRLLTAFPDLGFTVSHKIPRGDRVAERWVISGTHLGPYMGIPPTGKWTEIPGMSIVRLRDGRFVSDRFYWDSSNVMRRIGLFPPTWLLRSLPGRTLLAMGATLARTLGRSSPLDESFSSPAGLESPDLTSQEQANLQVLMDAIDSLNRRYISRFAGLLSADVTLDNQAGSGVQRGRDAVVEDISTLVAAFPDASLSVVQTVIRGGEIACEWTLEGTHEGTFLGIPATGRSVRLPGISMVTVENGAITDLAVYVDSGKLWRQLGLMPPLSLVDTPPVRVLLWSMVNWPRVALGVLVTMIALALFSRRRAT